MLTKLTIRNFKLFDKVEIELGERVVFAGPNNSGKTSASQALALWNAGVRRWVEKRGAGNVPRERAGGDPEPPRPDRAADTVGQFAVARSSCERRLSRR